MIEYCHYMDNWEDVTAKIINSDVDNLRFELYRLRFNGVIYTEHSTEFRTAFEKQVMWERLNARV
jgi:hypothetical protein